MDLDSNPDILLVRKHLVQHLGPPNEVFEVRGSPIPSSPLQALHLSYFAPGGPESPVVFATCGACLFKMNDGRRVEAIMLFRRQPTVESFPAIHRLLSSFAIFSEANNEAVRIGDVVRAPEDLHRFCRMDAILFLPPVPFIESFHRIALTHGQSVEVIWLLPVYEKEASYALTYGPQALMMLFAGQGLDLTDTIRDEANTDIAPEMARALAQQRSEEERKRAAQDPRSGPARARALRRQPGEGSYEVLDDAQAVTVVRRGSKPKPKTAAEAPKLTVVPNPEPAPAPAPPPAKAGQGAAPAASPGAAPQKGPQPQQHPPQGAPAAARPSAKPIRLQPVKAEPVVRFDMPGREQTGPGKRPAPGAGAPQKPGAPGANEPQRSGAGKSSAPLSGTAAQERRAAAAAAETPEAKAEAKRKRIEELKAKAAEAAKRAAERAAPGGATEAPAEPEPADKPSAGPPVPKNRPPGGRTG